MADPTYTTGERILPRDIEEEVKDSYLTYAMSVIVGRALPDVRDGLKPVHRRILYAMQELGLDPGKPYKKSARIVGEVLGKYHPHGDMAVYDTLVRLVQTFSMRYPLVDGQGNFGSTDGDAAAAMRYTEARLASIATELLADLDKDTVTFMPNFDESLQEPRLLPARLPNLLVNGSSGIAVGMATNIPPHNLHEVADACIRLIDEPDCPTKELYKIIKGPDFPTGATICGREGIRQAYETGRGQLKVRATAHIETAQRGGRDAIIVTELPYQANKTNLLQSIASLVQEKRVEGVADLRDESDKEGTRIVIELKREAIPQVALNQLYKHTQLETTFSIIMLALVEGRPRVLALRQVLQHYLDHRREIVTRRTRYELAKAQERAHILEGLKVALKHLDAVIATIRKSKSPELARAALMEAFELSERQAVAILEMQLQRLTALERDKIDQEYLDVIKRIELYQSILASEKKLFELIREELLDLKKRHGDDRRTEIVGDTTDLEVEDLIAEEDVVITISHAGYIKRLPISAYRKQRRGGVGVTAMETREEDFVEHLFIASTHAHLLFFTSKGKVHWLKVHEIPQASRQAKGKAIVNLLAISSGEELSAFVATKDFPEDAFLLLVTKQGVVKKTRLSAYANPRRAGIIAVTLEPGDILMGACITDGKRELLLVTRQGKAIRFPESQVREVGRSARGVRGMRLAAKDDIVAMEVVKPEHTILTVTEAGFSKRSAFTDYRLQSRGGKGVINLRVTSKNGRAVGARSVTNDDEIMLITQQGMMVRCPVKEIRVTGRNAQGVRLMALKGKDRVTALATAAPRDTTGET